MANTVRKPSQASIALRKVDLGYNLLKQLPEPRVRNAIVNGPRRKTPGTDDEPLSSSDDDLNSTKDLHNINNVTRSTSEGWRQPQTTERSGKDALKADTPGNPSPAFRDPSSKMNRPSQVQRRSTRVQDATKSLKRPRDVVETGDDSLLDEFGLIPSSQGCSKSKKLRVYGPAVNIHASGSAGRYQYASKTLRPTATIGAKDCFRTPNLEGLEEKLKEIESGLPEKSFKDVTGKGTTNPRSLRYSKRSAYKGRTSSRQPQVDEFKEPNIYHSRPSASGDGGDTCRFIIPTSSTTNDGRIRDVRKVAKGVLGNGLGGFKIPVEPPGPTSSATASLSLSSFESGQSPTSSLSSPPASPILDASTEHRDFLALDIPDYSAPVTARCPICKEEVDRDFLDSFDCGKRMNIRTQTRFCRAHKQKTARSKWRERRYPQIDWATFNARLKRHHPTIKGILDSDIPSYYRNVLQDLVKSGRNRTLHQSLMSTGFHGLTPGYYGSRGARLMMDNIMSNFSSQIRRLAATDKLISSGGVSGYVQAVLVPELAVLLVKEDMGVDDESARTILQESIEIGDLLNEEEEEVIQGVVEMTWMI